MRPRDYKGQVRNSKKLKSTPKWRPEIEFEKLVAIMIESELKARNVN